MYPRNARSAFARQMEAEAILETLAAAVFEEWAPTAVTVFSGNDVSVARAAQQWRTLFAVLYGYGAAYLYGQTMVRAAAELGIEFPANPDAAAVSISIVQPAPGVDTRKLQRKAARIVNAGLGDVLTAAAEEPEGELPEDPFWTPFAFLADPAVPLAIRQAQANYLANSLNSYADLPDAVYRAVTTELADALALGESVDEMAERVQQVVPDMGVKMARMIARTESAAAMTNATLAAAKHNTAPETVLTKCWVATVDGKTRREHFALDGQRVPVDGKFRIGRYRLDHPGDGPPEMSRNCRCALIVLAADEPLPGERDRQTERGPGDSTVRNRQGTRADEINRRAADGVVRARDSADGLGSV